MEALRMQKLKVQVREDVEEEEELQVMRVEGKQNIVNYEKQEKI